MNISVKNAENLIKDFEESIERIQNNIKEVQEFVELAEKSPDENSSRAIKCNFLRYLNQ
ncbi:hypothetical protein [Viridibacillus sp. FSL H8-0123]|uniref:hypothetical protein n=1 Tax=Viridibacillus sp. FSL H8-0123 TaxID=1928922 RepID=UPI00143C66D7|nr:hypothetical protein [Viridibacillus sp. FSL H8-0123]